MPSDYKEESIKYKDFQHMKEETRYKKKPSKKNTRKWCKGKVGREHELENVPISEVYGFKADYGYVEVCKKCKKRVHWHWRAWKDIYPNQWNPK